MREGGRRKEGPRAGYRPVWCRQVPDWTDPRARDSPEVNNNRRFCHFSSLSGFPGFRETDGLGLKSDKSDKGGGSGCKSGLFAGRNPGPGFPGGFPRRNRRERDHFWTVLSRFRHFYAILSHFCHFQARFQALRGYNRARFRQKVVIPGLRQARFRQKVVIPALFWASWPDSVRK